MNRLGMKWITEDGQLVCRWIETLVVDAETQRPRQPAFSVYPIPSTATQSQWQLDLGAHPRTSTRAASTSGRHLR